MLARWRTASELDTLGFHVYREVSGRRVRVDRKHVPARGASGRTYSYLDRTAPRRKALRYWIQVVNLDGLPPVVRAGPRDLPERLIAGFE